ncbi:MAG: SEC-C domain-containing protein [Phycisphaerae bacterium]|nr:SEC-C domain-containing protein [Phycisphaerae bacterium]
MPLRVATDHMRYVKIIMTLIIAAGNSDQFIQVSDRRLIANGVVQDDESNKSIILLCKNARLAVGFTGLAKAGSFNTREWLLRTLNKCAPPDYTAKELIERFAEKATKYFCNSGQLKNIQPMHKRLSIMFTGYLALHDPPLLAHALVSNFENLDKCTYELTANDKFECFFGNETRPNNGDIVILRSIGTLPPIQDNDLQILTELVIKRKPARAIVDKLIEIIRKLSEEKLAYNTIGKQLNSIVLPRDSSLSAKSGYHSNLVKMESYMPDLVIVTSEKRHMNLSNMSIRPAEPDNTPPLSGPKLRPRQPCWCGSGKRYKNCHGKPPQK